MKRPKSRAESIPNPPPELTLETIDGLAPVLEQVWNHRSYIAECLSGTKDYTSFLENYIDTIAKTRRSPVFADKESADYLESKFESVLDVAEPSNGEMHVSAETLQAIWAHRDRFLLCISMNRRTCAGFTVAFARHAGAGHEQRDEHA